MADWPALAVFIALFVLVTVLGFVAAHWRRGDLGLLNEWGLGGRRFGTIVTWFLLGGDLYTAYTFIAVPALVFGSGAIGFYALPYTIILYPFAFLVMPRLWSVARKHGYITASDFIRGRYESHGLALAVAVTGIVATMPYIALQLVGIEVVLAAMGIQGDLPLLIAFAILAVYTYFSGLRAPAMIALVKDTLIYITVIVAVIYIPMRLGGYGHIFASIPPAKLYLQPAQLSAYATLAFGSALALFLYPHCVTGVLASERRDVVRRNMALLPAYSFLLGLLALLGFMALVANIPTPPPYGAQMAIPGLINAMFPSWFVGFAFAAIAIGALVPASVMSIAAANLFTRNIYREYFRPNASNAEESNTAKLVSLIVKAGGLAFVVFLPLTYAIQFQLLGGVWIIQTLPAVIFGLYTRWFHRWALLIGWAVGLALGTWMAFAANLTSIYPLHIGSATVAGYPALWGLIANCVVAGVLSFVFNAIRLPAGVDQTTAADYLAERPAQPAPTLRPEPIAPAALA